MSPPDTVRETSSAAAASLDRNADDQFVVLVAGGGIGGLEAILALRECAPPGLTIELLSPASGYHLAPLSVLEPLHQSVAPELSLDEFCEEHEVDLIRAGLSEVWPGSQRVLTDDGTELPYDALLLSMGARRKVMLADAISFRGSGDVGRIEQLARLGEREGGRIAFVVPQVVTWTLPAYELALLLADQLRGSGARIEFLTHERGPLEVFGPAASNLAGDLLRNSGIVLELGVEDPIGAVADLDPERVVILPKLFVDEIPGLPQVSDGFVPVDAEMAVAGAERVWAVGDMTWSPIKQGGLAAQQADVAAAAIAAAAGAAVEVPAYAPVLRAALMTASGPYYLRSGTPDSDGELRAPLWWPPGKVAGRLLAPYLSKRLDLPAPGEALIDMPVDEVRAADHREAWELALRWADIDADEGDPRRALHWLEVAEALELALPDEYERKRARWSAELAGGGE